MNTGSRDEQTMLANIGRIARALERIADALEATTPPAPSRTHPPHHQGET
jgi:hypothetical protein